MVKFLDRINLDLEKLYNFVYNAEEDEARLDCGFRVTQPNERFPQRMILDDYAIAKYEVGNEELKGDLLVKGIDKRNGNVKLIWLTEDDWVNFNKEHEYSEDYFYLTKEELESCIIAG